jgi:hypothetical protein
MEEASRQLLSGLAVARHRCYPPCLSMPSQTEDCISNVEKHPAGGGQRIDFGSINYNRSDTWSIAYRSKGGGREGAGLILYLEKAEKAANTVSVAVT